MSGFSFNIKAPQKLLQEKGIAHKGTVQRYIDSEVLRLSAPYVPLDTSMLLRSGETSTVIGSGDIKYNTPYAKKQYYSPRHAGSRTGPLRGPMWFQRMKADHKTAILRGARKLASKNY